MRPSADMALQGLFGSSQVSGYGRRPGGGWTTTDDPRDIDPGIALPHVLTYAGMVRGSANTYFRLYWDEAWRHSQENAHAMLLDDHIGACMQELFDAVLSLRWHLEPEDKKDPVQAAVAQGCEKVIRRTPHLSRLLENLLWAKWYGRHGSQCQWEWKKVDLPLPQMPVPAMSAPGMNPGGLAASLAVPTRSLCVLRHFPVNGDKIGYTFDHHPMVRINGAYASRFKKADVVTDNLGFSLILRGGWRERFVIHTHRPFDTDFMRLMSQDAIHGMGDRSWLYFSWWTVNEYFTSIIDAIERYGLGFVAITFPGGNQPAEEKAKQIARTYSRRAVLVVPRWEGDRGAAGSGVEVVETPTAGMQILMELGRQWMERIERFITGQTLNSDHLGSGGVGGDAATFLKDARFNRVTRHARDLAETLTGTDLDPGLVSMVKKYTYPWADFPVRWVFDVDDPDGMNKVQAATAIIGVGGAVKEEEVMGAVGFTLPGPDDRVLGGAMLQPAPGEEEEGGDSAFNGIGGEE